MSAECQGKRSGAAVPGFTIVEMLVAMAVFALLVALLLSMITQSSSIWRHAQNEVGSYQSARFAMNLMTRTLSQSRMNVYGDYDNPSQPTTYLRKSDLQFVIDGPQGLDFRQGNSIFFQAPAVRTLNAASYGGLPGLLNSVGYYVTYGKDPNLPPFLQALDRNRFRLMQFLAPAEAMKTYTVSDKAWFQSDLTQYSSVIADNVILLLCWPRLSREEDANGSSLTTAYRYDSRVGTNSVPQPVTANQQPPLVQVTMVAIDKAVANRLANSSTPPAEITGPLQGLFTASTETDYKRDLAELESRLSAAHIGYQLFNSTVTLRETKWAK